MSIFAPIFSLPEFRALKVSLPLGRWVQVARERRALAGLGERQLRDLGIDPVEAAREAARPFWELPKGRR